MQDSRETFDQQATQASPQADRFVRRAQDKPRRFSVEILDFLLRHKKWWLAPIILVLLLLGLLIALSASGAAVFIYPLF